MTELKICSRCKTRKPLTEFYDNKNTKSGKESVCVACKIQAAKSSYQVRRQNEVKNNDTAPGGSKKRYVYLSDTTIRRIENLRISRSLPSFTAAVERMIEESSHKKLYFIPNSFSKAIAALDRNMMEISIIANNLNTLKNALLIGRYPASDSKIDQLDHLIKSMHFLKDDLSRSIQLISISAPRR